MAGDEESGDNKEDINADVTAGECAGEKMISNHKRYCNSSQSLDVCPEPTARWVLQWCRVNDPELPNFRLSPPDYWQRSSLVASLGWVRSNLQGGTAFWANSQVLAPLPYSRWLITFVTPSPRMDTP